MSELPSSWVDIEIGEVAEVISGGTPKANDAGNFTTPEEGIAWLTPADLSGYKVKEISHGARDLTPQGYQSCSAKLMPKGSLLFSSRAPIGYVAVAANEISTNQGFKSFVFSEVIDPSYAFYYLKSIRELADSLGTGTTFKELSSTTAKTLPFRLAPTAEQTRIAQKLDELLAQVDTLKARIDAIPALLKRFRQSVLTAAVSGRLTTEWRATQLASETNNGLPSLDQATVPATWLSLIHDEIADVIDPHPSHRTPSEDPNGVPYIGIGDVNEFGGINFEKARKVSRSVLDEHKERYSINDGDFIFGKIGTIGSATKIPVDGEYTISANVILVKPVRNKVVPCYHWLFWCSPVALEISAKGSKATSQAAFGIKKMRKAELLYPPMDEQTEIVRRVEQLFAFADQLEAKIKTAQARVNHLTQSILAKAFRGELVPQDPNDEPASVLLDRIQAQRAAAPKAKRGRKASA